MLGLVRRVLDWAFKTPVPPQPETMPTEPWPTESWPDLPPLPSGVYCPGRMPDDWRY